MMMTMTGSGAMASAGGMLRERRVWALRKMTGFAIVAGGFAVIGAQVLHGLGG
ncbi:hypothetical protein [Paraburkholderia antibiotica]|uniref:Uncharacterized protein n=1 Tax=Paraburkholderia antibiotica TaxID=2728839 RepID=A0A7X9ZWG7_9BURK|nr:hypothetical protein [Paraburkholderia antibiotica]NML30696.1 hypothetical protein [Paraburkholderia antibiotica]